VLVPTRKEMMLEEEEKEEEEGQSLSARGRRALNPLVTQPFQITVTALASSLLCSKE
jgi:hypothetical protein